MKTFTVVISCLLMIFPGVAIACAAEYIVPPPGLCVVGEVSDLREVAQNDWAVTIAGAKVLLSVPGQGDQDIVPAAGDEIGSLEIRLRTGFGGLRVKPNPAWIGRPVLVVAKKMWGNYRVVNSPLTPNGRGFMVFSPEDAGTIPLVEDAAGIARLSDNKARYLRFVNLVESPSQPFFLKRFAIGQIARLGLTETDNGTERRNQLLRWRDGDGVDPELRLYVDNMLSSHSHPASYLWNADRIAFLRKIKNGSGFTEMQRHKAAHELQESNRRKEAHKDREQR